MKTQDNFTNYLLNNCIYSKELYPLSDNIRSIIPLNLFQTWSTKNLPPKMELCVRTLKLQNPEFKYYMYDDNDCREFIKNNYSVDILDAYDKLIPTAYKADLWRLCILYKYGGIYLDIKFECNNNFKLLELTDREHYCFSQYKIKYEYNYHGIFNGILISKANNDFLYKCILQIVDNCKKEFYGYNQLYPTGPGLLGVLYPVNKNNILNDTMFDLFFLDDKIIYKKYCILRIYLEYRNEQRKNELIPHYSILWYKKKIYKKL